MKISPLCSIAALMASLFSSNDASAAMFIPGKCEDTEQRVTCTFQIDWSKNGARASMVHFEEWEVSIAFVIVPDNPRISVVGNAVHVDPPSDLPFGVDHSPAEASNFEYIFGRLPDATLPRPVPLMFGTKPIPSPKLHLPHRDFYQFRYQANKDDPIQNFLLTGLHLVPEPATWAMIISGFGLVAGAMRRKRWITAQL